MLKFRIDTDRLTLGDLLDMEGGKLPSMIAVMSRCMLDESDNYLPEMEAVKVLRAIPIKDVKEAVEKFGEALNEYKEGAIPPTGGGK